MENYDHSRAYNKTTHWPHFVTCGADCPGHPKSIEVRVAALEAAVNNHVTNHLSDTHPHTHLELTRF